MWWNIVEPARSRMALRRMRIACWVLKATSTHSKYVILLAFPLQERLHERASLWCYTCIVCLYVCLFEVLFSFLYILNVDYMLVFLFCFVLLLCSLFSYVASYFCGFKTLICKAHLVFYSPFDLIFTLNFRPFCISLHVELSVVCRMTCLLPNPCLLFIFSSLFLHIIVCYFRSLQLRHLFSFFLFSLLSSYSSAYDPPLYFFISQNMLSNFTTRCLVTVNTTTPLILDIIIVVFQFHLDAMLEPLDVPSVRYDEGKFLLIFALEGTIFYHWKLSQTVRVSDSKIKMKSVQNSTSVQNIRSLGIQHICKLSHPDCPTAEWWSIFRCETDSRSPSFNRTPGYIHWLE